MRASPTVTLASRMRRAAASALSVAPLLAAVLAPMLPQGAQAADHWGRYGPGWGRGTGFVWGLPALATVLTIGTLSYWVADGVYYRAAPYGGYMVVAPPLPVAPPALPPDAALVDQRLFIYPGNGQSADTQASDEYECHRWAAAQSGFDPTASPGAAGAAVDARRRPYQRAQAACLEGRGYTVR